MPCYNVRLSLATNSLLSIPRLYYSPTLRHDVRFFRKLYRFGVLHKRTNWLYKSIGISCGQLVSAYGLLAYTRRMQLQHGISHFIEWCYLL
jgi:hypothetical protein